jgi:carboxymethylenebutenolidase
VVVVQELLGLTDEIRGHADRMAATGYLALAPDLYTDGGALRCLVATFRTLNTGHGTEIADIAAARRHLLDEPDCTGRVGIIGFCMGGGFALMCAPRDGYSAAAVNYGPVPGNVEEALAGSCPMVASYGGRDLMGTDLPQRIDAALTAQGVPHDVKVYPEAGHSFMSPKPAAVKPLVALARLQYDKGAAEDAWQRIFAFFGTYLS